MRNETTETVTIALCGAALLGATIGSFYSVGDAIRGGGIGVGIIALLLALIRASASGER